jgi:hypothetical protein
MTTGYLLNRVVLQFKDEAILQDLSAAAVVDEYLWLASDETTTLTRLTRLDSCTFGKQKTFHLADLLDDFREEDGEVDIEGLACEDGYLWLIGSHSSKRKTAKGDNGKKLKTVQQEPNRYLLARIPIVSGELQKAHQDRRAAYLERSDRGNLLIDALCRDDLFAPFFPAASTGQKPIPGKDNGFDIEGLAICRDRLLVGLRGPVLRGMAILLEIEVKDTRPGVLKLTPIGKDDQPYKKHFVDLDGLGVRELCNDGDDLLILAGPTMDLDGSLRLFRLKQAFDLSDNSLSTQESGDLKLLFEIPYGRGSDRAEGLSLFPGFGKSPCALVVYDSPDPRRIFDPTTVLADIFRVRDER